MKISTQNNVQNKAYEQNKKQHYKIMYMCIITQQLGKINTQRHTLKLKKKNPVRTQQTVSGVTRNKKRKREREIFQSKK